MRGHLKGNTSSCAFRVLCLPLQLLFADSLERQTLQGEAVAFADLKTNLSADRVSCGIILARGNPHDSAVQPMSRDSVLRRDFQCKCCRKILSAVIVVSNLIDIAVYRQDIAADRAALPVAGLCYIKTRRQRGKIKSVVDRSNRICVVLCIQLSQLGIPAEVQTCEVITGTIQIFQLRKIFNTRKISDFHIVDINILHQRDFPCAEFTILIPINIGFFIKKKLSEILIREVGLVDSDIRAVSCNRQCENNVLFLVIQFRTGITDVIGIDHDSGIAIYCKSASADFAAGQAGHAARIKAGQARQIKGIACQCNLANITRCIQIRQLGVTAEIERGQRVIGAVHIFQLWIMTEIERGQRVIGANHPFQLRILAEIQYRQAICTAIQLFQLGILAEIEFC